ncbi:heparinase II/III domain-containing protein [Lapidilactobacillus bayanensis]|uniref:heparinase II/III domain-containing protein n=1 Tax=Lapidilactobacillus bayanensis TaxID=2485998 RepID=UPI000F7929F9|nr:heparinase II/III family protein [Lapidilactobacillus bayanensis]
MLKNENTVHVSYNDKSLRQGMIAEMKTDIQRFYADFNDQVFKNSAWGHHYFCPEDGNVLSFDVEQPRKHHCPLCSRIYISALLDRAWVTNYRNLAATTVLKAAVVYQKTGDCEYAGIAIQIASFYLKNFQKFKLHDKQDNFFDDLSSMTWGCGRVMPQSLNESIFFTRIFTSLYILKDILPDSFKNDILNPFTNQFYQLLAPQINKIHNIPLWLNDGLGIVGLFTGRKDIQDFVFEGEYCVASQLKEGLTADSFWYEGSIHYNCFTIEGLLYLALFCKEYDFFREELTIIPQMLKQVYQFSFSNQQLPNPNDGWPNLNLKTYSYLFAMGCYIFPDDQILKNIFYSIIASDYTRTDIPLSKPYYFQNELSLEQFLLFDKVAFDTFEKIPKESHDFLSSNYVLLTNKNDDLFLKYGHNGPSHAHPDKMNLEAVLAGKQLLKDLSNSGYGSKVCKEWHRATASHNTIMVDGRNQTSFEKGRTTAFTESSCTATAVNVYPGVNYQRTINLVRSGFKDDFIVSSDKEHVYDLIFHILAKPRWHSNIELVDANLGYEDNGYQYFKNIKQVKCDDSKLLELYWDFYKKKLVSTFDISDKEVFYCQSPSNPITEYLPTVIIRGSGQYQQFKSIWKLQEE